MTRLTTLEGWQGASAAHCRTLLELGFLCRYGRANRYNPETRRPLIGMTREVVNQFSKAVHFQHDPADRSGKSVLSLDDADGIDDFRSEASDGEWEMDDWCAERALERGVRKFEIAPSQLRGMIDAKAAKLAANPRQKRSTRGPSTGTPYCMALVACANTRVQCYFAPSKFVAGKQHSIRKTAAGSHISETGQSAVRSDGDLSGFALAFLNQSLAPPPVFWKVVQHGGTTPATIPSGSQGRCNKL